MKIYKLSSYCQNCPVQESFWETREKAKDEMDKRIANNPTWTKSQIDYYISEIEVK